MKIDEAKDLITWARDSGLSELSFEGLQVKFFEQSPEERTAAAYSEHLRMTQEIESEMDEDERKKQRQKAQDRLTYWSA